MSHTSELFAPILLLWVLAFYASPSPGAEPIRETLFSLHSGDPGKTYRNHPYEFWVPAVGDLYIDLGDFNGPIEVTDGPLGEIRFTGLYSSRHWQPASVSAVEALPGKWRFTFDAPIGLDPTSPRCQRGYPIPLPPKSCAGALPRTERDLLSEGNDLRPRLVAKPMPSIQSLTVEVPKEQLQAIRVVSKYPDNIRISGMPSLEMQQMNGNTVLIGLSRECAGQLDVYSAFDY